MDQELMRLGVAGIVCVLLWVMLVKSEKREEKKDMRIQTLENQLIESYDERIAASDRVGDAIHGSAIASNNAAKAIEALTIVVKSKG